MKITRFAILLGLSTAYLCSATAQNAEICYIPNIDSFVDQCPTSDPAIDEILSDFRITRDGVNVTDYPCEEPISALPIEQYTDELILLQALRVIYYLDKGMTGHLPWTDGSLYEWLKSKVGGFDLSSTATNHSCCRVWPDGTVFVTLVTANENSRNFFRASEHILGRVHLIAHEARHRDGFGHVGCCALGGSACDLRYDESNLSPYAIQYWLSRAWLDGTLITGYACLGTERVAAIRDRLLLTANSSAQNRFCENPPSVLDQATSAPCVDCRPPPTANDDGPYVIDEGGAVMGTFNILENDTDPESDTLTPFVVDFPAHASFFEVRPDGTFDYTHDGSETTSDSFTYRASDGINESDVATVSLEITPVNDAPEISLIGGSSINLIGGNAFNDPGATAEDAEDGDISDSIVVGGDAVDIQTDGTYVITYDVVDSDGLSAKQVTRTVNVTIDDPPEIILNGSASLTLTVGDTYIELGATAQDPEDGNISGDIVIGGDAVNTSVAATYIVTYHVSDSAGNAAAEVTRTVNVAISNVLVDDPPVITLNGSASLTLTVGDTYVEQGATAQDPEDGDISGDIVIRGDAVNTSVAGTYIVTFNVSDSAGNAAPEVTRRVIVNAAPVTPPSLNNGGSGGGAFGLLELLALVVAGLLSHVRRLTGVRGLLQQLSGERFAGVPRLSE